VVDKTGGENSTGKRERYRRVVEDGKAYCLFYFLIERPGRDGLDAGIWMSSRLSSHMRYLDWIERAR
jgi:hypothetical protein